MAPPCFRATAFHSLVLQSSPSCSYCYLPRHLQHAQESQERAKQQKGLNAAEIKELQQLFEMYDVDGSGSVSVEELANALDKNTVYYQGRATRVTDNRDSSVGQSDFARLFAKYDIDASGDVTMNEFVEMMKHMYS